MQTQRLFYTTALISAAFIAIALVLQSYSPLVRPGALVIGCLFALFNLLFYKYIVAAILDSNSPHRGLAAVVALLKLPLLAGLLLLLTRESGVVIGNVLAGSLVFIPAAILGALLTPESDSGTEDRVE